MINGHVGVGKRTHVRTFLKQLLQCDDALFVKVANILPVTRPTTPIPGILAGSGKLVQFKPHGHGVYDKTIITDLIDEYLKYSLTGGSCTIIVVEDAERLTRGAQEALKKTLEDTVVACRFIFVNNMTTHMLPALVSRCLNVNVTAPTRKQLIDVMKPKLLLQHADDHDDVACGLIAKYKVASYDKALQVAECYASKLEYINPVRLVAQNIVDDVLKPRVTVKTVVSCIRHHSNQLMCSDVDLLFPLIEELLDVFVAVLHAKSVKQRKTLEKEERKPFTARTYNMLHAISERALFLQSTVQTSTKESMYVEEFVLFALEQINLVF